MRAGQVLGVGREDTVEAAEALGFPAGVRGGGASGKVRSWLWLRM